MTNVRKIASIQLIETITPISGADKIEVAKIQGWRCVVNKGKFQPGDFCVFIEIDAFLPLGRKQYAFLENEKEIRTLNVDETDLRGIVVKTVRLRGVVSQGLAFRLEEFPEIDEETKANPVIGTDLSKTLSIEKYEEPIPDELLKSAEGYLPFYVPQSGEIRLQNIEFLLSEEKLNGLEFHMTEKLDGTSMSVYKFQGNFRIASKSVVFLPGVDNEYTRLAKRYDLENRLPEGYAIQGELVGPGIAGNKLGLPEQDIYVFNVLDIGNRRYLDYEEYRKFVNDIGMKSVPDHGLMSVYGKTTEEIVRTVSGLRSKIPTCKHMEGIVFRPDLESFFDARLSRLSFKVISERFLLENGGIG